ncbi:MAG: segregation/condensation protein A, partial [Planctomycetota bacterium]
MTAKSGPPCGEVAGRLQYGRPFIRHRMDYRVSLDIFDGPLDLLLHLIRKHELDVCDVSLVRITDAYVNHVQLLREAAERGEAVLDIDTVGDFLVVAATLIEMKSAALLPRPEMAETSDDGEAEQTDPKLELVRQLLEYKKIKDSVGQLDHMREEHARRFPRIPAVRAEQDGPDANVELPPLELEELHVWDLLSIFERLMTEVGRRGPANHEVTYDDTPIDLHAADIADRVRRDGHASLRELMSSKV